MTATDEPSRLGALLRDGAHCDRSGPAWRSALAFSNANPWVLSRLEQICFQLRAKGFTRYSTRTLIAVLRFEWDLQTTGQRITIADHEERVLKLNNNHTAYYARILIEAHPSLWDFFELRSVEGDPFELPPPPPVQLPVEPRHGRWFTEQLALL